MRRLEASDHAAWDALVAASSTGTLLHTRRFLSYHGDRFADRSLVLENDTGNWCGVLPAALDTADGSIVVSHPGISYGGLLHSGELTGLKAVRALRTICSHYSGQGIRLLRYKAVPWIYHRRPAQDDAYALFRMNAKLYRRDLSTAIDLSARGRLSERRRRGIDRARKQGVEVVEGFAAAGAFWDVLAENLAARHGVKPVHTLEEIALLHSRFPNEIKLLVAEHGGVVVAGALLFQTDRVSHAQYIAATPKGRELAALDAVFDVAIRRASADGRRYFDFGISTEQGGQVLNEGLYEFKADFGGSGVVHDFYEIALT